MGQRLGEGMDLDMREKDQQGRRQGRWCSVKLIIIACVLPIDCERSGRIVFVHVRVERF